MKNENQNENESSKDQKYKFKKEDFFGHISFVNEESENEVDFDDPYLEKFFYNLDQ